jgi:hypothetical protein
MNNALILTIFGALAVIVMLATVYRMGAAGFFGGIADFLESIERSVIDILSAFVPYCVPVIPAYLTYYHTQNMMGFPAWVAATAAFVVETLGMASVSTAIKFWRNNLLYKSEQNKAPFKLAAGVYAFYIVIVLVVNVVLEKVAGTRNGWVIFSIALFSLLSFPSGVLIAIRAQFREILDARHKPKTEVKNEPTVERRPKHASDYRDKIIALTASIHRETGKLPLPKEITVRLKLDHEKSKGYVSQAITDWAKDNNVEKKKPLGF